MTFANITAGIIFGLIGMVALGFGKKQGNFKIMLTGVLLILYPYFVHNTVIVYLVGTALTVAIFIFRD
ncbi:MAG: hypothetical protein PHV55_04080 [Candidatus Omnitrophica bacterium]|nr:hypothetical protein [Candidatus Omnitrophota bacterium]